MYMPFIMAQFYPRFYTMIPAGVAIGLGGGPLWCAKCTYLTVISEVYGKISNMSPDIVVTRFFGIFFMFYSFSQVWGNLISSAILSSGDDAVPSSNTTIVNATTLFLKETKKETLDQISRDLCGANACPGVSVAAADNSTVPILKPHPTSKIQLIAGVYLLCMMVACLIVSIGVDKMSRYGKGRKGSGGGISGLKLLAVTLKQLGNVKQILILPITMFIGAEQAFIAADFTADFVSCGWGISNIGFVMICYGICNGIASIFSGSIVKITGRNPVICFALSIHFALLVTLLVWRPSPENKPIFFLISGLWGMCDALWLVQINSLSGILFPGKEEAAYSNFRLWESTGSVITYVCSPYLCNYLKIYLLMGLLIVGVLGYSGVEYMERDEADSESSKHSAKTKFELIDGNGHKSGEVAD
nr:UNC93-like protein [Leptinotarsa decemlineata]